MDDMKGLLNMMPKKESPSPKENSGIKLIVDGQEITDPKEIVSYVQENMMADQQSQEQKEMQEMDELLA